MHFTAVLILLTVSSIHGAIDIVYKLSDVYELIWNDKGSEGDNDGSIWRVKNYQSEYCSIGDVSVRGYSAPTTKAILITAKKQGAIVKPTGFSKIWTDAGSGADRSVAIWVMHAPGGYTCLGNAATNGPQPIANKYCCVRDEYVVRGATLLTYNDKGSGADHDISLWQVIRGGADASGITGGNFLSSKNHYTRPQPAFLLKESAKIQDVWSIPAEVKPLSLYEMNQLKWIWNDGGSGADQDGSIWRAESKAGYYPVGDIIVASHGKPRIGFLVKPANKNSDALRLPVSYTRIWRDAGSGGDHDLHVWKVFCPSGYVALGNVATSGRQPKQGDIYCVKVGYTIHGNNANWRRVWTDKGSGADRDVSMHEAVETQQKQQTVRGFGTIGSHGGKPNPPFLLNKKFVVYRAEKPISRIIMTNVKYQLNNEKQQTDPVRMSPTEIPNYSETPQTATRTIDYSVTESKSFTFTQSIEVGISVEITAQVPLIGSGQSTTLSVVSTSTFETGSSTEKTSTDSIAAQIIVPAKSQMTAVVIGTQYKSDIPFTATIKKIYYDGTFAYAQISGVYKGVAVTKFKVIYQKAVPLPED